MEAKWENGAAEVVIGSGTSSGKGDSGFWLTDPGLHVTSGSSPTSLRQSPASEWRCAHASYVGDALVLSLPEPGVRHNYPLVQISYKVTMGDV
jgi:hypothetical protein